MPGGERWESGGEKGLQAVWQQGAVLAGLQGPWGRAEEPRSDALRAQGHPNQAACHSGQLQAGAQMHAVSGGRGPRSGAACIISIQPELAAACIANGASVLTSGCSMHSCADEAGWSGLPLRNCWPSCTWGQKAQPGLLQCYCHWISAPLAKALRPVPHAAQ